MLKGHIRMNIMNTAIIGCGAIFSNHAEAIAGLKSAKLYAVCDVDREKAEKAAQTV